MSPVSQRQPRQLARASSVVQQTGIDDNPIVDLDGLSITFTVTDLPVEVEVECPWVPAAGNGFVYLFIRDGANVDKCVTARYQSNGDAFVQERMRATEYIDTPGTYTRKASMVTSAAGLAATNNANAATTRSSITAREVLV